MQGGDHAAGDYAGGIYVALPVIAADDPALPHFKTTLEDLLLTGRVDFSEYQRACPADSRVAGGIGAIFRESCLVIRAAGVFAEESEGTDAHIVLFGGTGGELARIFAEVAQQLVEFRGIFFGDGRAKGFGEGLRYTVAAQVGVVVGEFAARGVAQLFAFVVLRLVVEEGDAVHRRWRRQ